MLVDTVGMRRTLFIILSLISCTNLVIADQSNQELEAEVAQLRQQVTELQEALRIVKELLNRHHSKLESLEVTTNGVLSIVTTMIPQVNESGQLSQPNKLPERVKKTADQQGLSGQSKSYPFYLRRWLLHGNGVLEVTLANHGDDSVHINAISVPSRTGVAGWSGIGHFVRPGAAFTHRIKVDQEPVFFDLQTSVGQLRFDLVRDDRQ